MRLAATLALASVTSAQVPLDWQAALNRIREDSLRGHVSFLASDLLEGRATPSRGLDIAGEYIAAQFRRAGLDPGGTNGYFHETNRDFRIPGVEGFRLELRAGGKTLVLGPRDATPYLEQVADYKNIPTSVVHVGSGEVNWDDLEGRIVAVTIPERWETTAGIMRSPGRALRLFRQAASPVLTLLADANGVAAQYLGRRARQLILVHNHEAVSLMRNLPAGASGLEVSVQAGPQSKQSLPLRNVVAVLRGSDPVLRESYVMLTAHYDHEGILPIASADRILNGANDDASGTAAVIELAEALSRLPVRPKRSIIFGAFAGEEIGLVGSTAYADKPVFPLSATVAVINLEHLGRTDMDGRTLLRKANVTGFDYSDMGTRLAAAAALTGVEIFNEPTLGDRYFVNSDNLPFARKGIPAHTVSVGYLFPDFHAAGDHWDKLDYANYAAIVRAVGLGLLRIADDPVAPRWNESRGDTESYRKARTGLTGQ
jgi:hypothetical protein